jgi:LysM repeat protein
VNKRIALVLALVTILSMVVTPVALADENEGGWWGNIVGYPHPGSPICLTAVDGSMINNCHAQDPIRPYEPIKFDGVPPKVYIVTSGPAKAFLFAQPGLDNWVDWGWMVPDGWKHGMPTPHAPLMHQWHPGGGMSMDGPEAVEIKVNQMVDVTGSGSVKQTVSVDSPIATKITVGQAVNMKAAAAGPAPMAKDGKDGKDGKAKCFTYIVKCGDNLTKIAGKYGDTVSGLVSRNHVTNPSKIFIGQKLVVCDP